MGSNGKLLFANNDPTDGIDYLVTILFTAPDVFIMK